MAYLEMSGITKEFPGVRALDNVDFDLQIGETHALVGENGAGKSTLVKVLAGAISKDAGEIRINGQHASISSPKDAIRYGIITVQQHFSLQSNMTVAENILFGSYPKRRRFIDWKSLYDKAESFLAGIGFDDINVKSTIAQLGVAEAQKVEIAKALYRKPRILIMDEPSAVLPKNDLKKLYLILDRIKKETGIIYISHHFEEIFAISDRITVLKDGKKVKTVLPSEVDEEGLVKLMVGRELGDMYPAKKQPAGEEVVLSVKELTTGKLNKITFRLKKGEILGIAGLIGAGRTELCEALFGLVPLTHGEIMVNGEKIENTSPRRAIQNGFGFVTEDRHKTGLILPMAVRNNLTLAGYKKVCRCSFIDTKKDIAAANEYVEKLKISTPSIEQLVEFLSGGNQQKVVLAKWLFSEAKILLFDEPTRGIDVATKTEIYRLMRKLTMDGVSIIMISSELPEIIGMSDRILVMKDGCITGELFPDETSEEEILSYAAGLKAANQG